MLTASRPETIGETPKILFINLIQDCDHSMLNDFILQRRDPQWPLPAIRLRDIHSPGWLRSIGAAVNPTVQISEPTFQSGFIFRPRDAVHSRCSFSLQSVEALPEQTDCQMMEKGGELQILPFPCCFTHTRQPLGYASLALCRVRAGLMSVLLDQRPSLLTLRRWFPIFVRVIHRYCSAVRLLEGVRVGRTAIAFSHRPVVWFTSGT